MKKTAFRRLAKLLPAGRDLIEEEERPEALRCRPCRPSSAIPVRRHRLNSLLAEQQAPPVMGSRAAARSRLPPTRRTIFRSPTSAAEIARETGAQRRAVPGEYREENAAAELEAWLAGYDGKEPGHAGGTA